MESHSILFRVAARLLLVLAAGCPGGAADIPRIVWIAWFQGWDKAPDVSQRCLQSWREMNPTWDVRAITGSEDYLADLQINTSRYRYKMAQESDLLRLVLLQQFGGVWVDSTMLCRRPLDDWLFEKTKPSGFFAFAPEGNLSVMSSFLAAEQNHPIISEWHSHLEDYFQSGSEALGYFAVHEVFRLLTNGTYSSPSSPTPRQLWERTPNMTADYGAVGPHFWVPYETRLAASCTPELRHAIESDRTTPVWKLTHWQVSWAKVPEDSCMKLLLPQEKTSLRAHRRAVSHSVL